MMETAVVGRYLLLPLLGVDLHQYYHGGFTVEGVRVFNLDPVTDTCLGEVTYGDLTALDPGQFPPAPPGCPLGYSPDEQVTPCAIKLGGAGWYRARVQNWCLLTDVARSAAALERAGVRVYPIVIEAMRQPMPALEQATLSRYRPEPLVVAPGWRLPFSAAARE